MTLISRLRAGAVIGVAGLAVAVPALASGKSNPGNHCGHGHAKHARALGQTCLKHTASARAAAVLRQAKQEREAATTEQTEDQAGATDQADAIANEQGDAADNGPAEAADNEPADAADNEPADAADNEPADAADTGQADD